MLMPFDVRGSLIGHLKILCSTHAGNALKYFASKNVQNCVKTGVKIFGFMS